MPEMLVSITDRSVCNNDRSDGADNEQQASGFFAVKKIIEDICCFKGRHNAKLSNSFLFKSDFHFN